MTIPSTIILPLHSEKIKGGGESLDVYMRELVFSLQDMYEQLAYGVNGEILSDTDFGSKQFLPTISGSTDAGTGTYDDTGDHQVGWVLRQGIFVDVWFDVQWSAHTGTGNLTVDLPYKVAISAQKPFVGVVQSSNITYAGDSLVGNAEPDSRSLNIWESSSAAPTAQIAMDTAGQLIGFVRYVGQEIERD